MKVRLYQLFSIVALLAACSGNRDNSSADSSGAGIAIATDKAVTKPGGSMQYCFFRTDGLQSQDTTDVTLLISGNKVTGFMNWLPKEKDSRKGKLTGKLTGNQIKAVWTYGQEGSTDTMMVEFELRGTAFAQKPYQYNHKTGREQTNSSAGYEIIFNIKNCK